MKTVPGFAIAVLLLFAGSPPAAGIVYGEFDGPRHPSTGALAAERDGQLTIFCTGVLIAPRAFLTAAHCPAVAIANDVPADEMYVTFDPRPDPTSEYHRGRAFLHPGYGPAQSDPHDIAVVVLDEPIEGIDPVQLPRRGMLDDLKVSRQLKSQTFVAVGYGDVRTSRQTGPQGIVDSNERRWADQTFQSLQDAWLSLSVNQATGDGGSCSGDSGGPHFLGDETSELVVSITVTGDAMCKATDKTYRLDVDPVRHFLRSFDRYGVVIP